jgi:hypothetical protein
MCFQVEVNTWTNSYRRSFVSLQAARLFAESLITKAKNRLSATIYDGSAEVMTLDNRKAA